MDVNMMKKYKDLIVVGAFVIIIVAAMLIMLQCSGATTDDMVVSCFCGFFLIVLSLSYAFLLGVLKGKW